MPTDLPPNIRLGCKCLTLLNTLAYYDTATITTVKSFIVQTLGVRKNGNFELKIFPDHNLRPQASDILDSEKGWHLRSDRSGANVIKHFLSAI